MLAKTESYFTAQSSLDLLYNNSLYCKVLLITTETFIEHLLNTLYQVIHWSLRRMGKDDTKQNKTIFTLRQSIKGNKMQQHYYNSRQAIKAMR
jgi:hypothetical protein